MKKRTVTLLAWVLALALFAGCAGPTAPTLELRDSRESYAHDERSAWDGFLAAEVGDYYVTNRGTGGLIYVCPKGMDRFIPLCGKPDCTHADAGCNAYVDVGIGIGLFQNRIWTTEFSSQDPDHGRCVTSRALDGTDKREDYPLPFPQLPDGSRGGSDYSVFHNNLLIRAIDIDESLPFEQQIERVQILDLKTGELQEPFQDHFVPGVRLGRPIRPVDNRIFAPEEVQEADGSVSQWLICMDLDTGEVRRLTPGDDVSSWYLEEDKLCFVRMGSCRCVYDLETGETEEFPLEIPDAVYERKDDYGYYVMGPIHNDRMDITFYFFDHDRRQIDQLDLTDGWRLMYVDDTRYWFGQFDPQGTLVSAYLDKSAIGSGNLKLTQSGR